MSANETKHLVSFNDTLFGWDEPEERIRRAFRQEEFILYAQPIVKLVAEGDRRPHFEVFVRLLEEEQNLIPPGTFLPMLEHLDLGPQLDRYVVGKLVKWFQVRQKEKKLGVAHVNLCNDTFADAQFCPFVEAELKQAQIDGDVLCFEFPSDEAGNPAGTLALANGLRKVGCRISVGATEDDHIEFRQMQELGASFLKLGRTLVHDLTRNEAAAVEVKTAARACRAFNVRTIAQHVEDAPTLDLLRKLDVNFAQGYGISKPGILRGATSPAADQVRRVSETAT